jgi:2-polyprenyl-3-methyl-5-hydroxy-6-metoxy-1,4-benzoquinol methylase
MSQKTTGIYKILSFFLFYRLTQKIMSGVSFRSNFVKNFIKNKNNYILDIGCGTADILESIPNNYYYGFDISQNYINYAKNKFYKNNYHFFNEKFNQNSIKKLPKFDFVILFGILHHLSNIEINSLCFNVKKVLKKSGVILIVDPVLIKKQNFISKLLIKLDRGKNIKNFNEYNKTLKKHFKKITYKITHQKFIPYTWYSAACKK